MKHSTPIPTDEDFNYVHPAPKKYLCADVPADKMHHILMKEKLWTSWSGDTYGIVNYDDQEKPFEVDVKGKAVSIREKSFIRNSKGEVVAVMAIIFLAWEPTFKIFGLTPYMEGQEPVKDLTHEDKPLYEWATCVSKVFRVVRKTMTMADGVEFIMDGVGEIFALRQMCISRDGKPAAYCRQVHLATYVGNKWEVKIGPGIDAAMIIGFVAIIDQFNQGAFYTAGTYLW
uniref:Phospholipid scramblase n=1 Tax=Helicotheca tamesis TaxID=374047 RepID=A0A7S2HMM0_9STRA|mmetsp:Transcript_19402/g.26626  ORF Transcript_19402/g.26626 Transcript_19402/m.26626 type:complete len:229 (+) Transcript_19402:98-784(+)